MAKQKMSAEEAYARELYKRLFGVYPTIVPYVMPADKRRVRIDPELGRLAIALRLTAQFRIWAVAQHLSRIKGGSGQLSRDALRAGLDERGITYTDRHLRRLMQQGDGLFWNLDDQRIFLRGWQYVACKLVERALAQDIGSLHTNRPGARPVNVDPAGSLENFEAHLYLAWHNHRKADAISRETLMALFNRSRKTLLRWEKQHLADELRVRPNFAQCGDRQRYFDYIPPHAHTYGLYVRNQRGDVVPLYRVRWQLPNTYLPHACHRHKDRGQASKVRKAVNALVKPAMQPSPEELEALFEKYPPVMPINAEMPADEMRGGSHRIYVQKPKSVRRLRRKYPDAEVFYVWRGEDFQHKQQGIFEITDDGCVFTLPGERRVELKGEDITPYIRCD